MATKRVGTFKGQMQDRNRKSLNPDFDKTYRSQVSQQMLFKNPSLLSASV